MAYQVYLLESIDVDNWIELDCEDVDFATVFSVADVSDVSIRKDKITKQIAFKGTNTNNQAFGSMFHLNQVSDFEVDNRLFFNYNPLRTVDCLIYEDGVMLLRGSIRVLEVNVDTFSNVTYQTVVTGSFIDFRDIVSEKMLEDLDFVDFKHRYNWSNIQDSWEIRTERWDTSSNQYVFKPFSKGSGYVYPFIDYGVIYKKTSANADVNAVNVENFKPAVYVKEIFDRIFKQPELSGYTYEIDGDIDLSNRFNSLVIPTNVEKMTSKSTELGSHVYSVTPQVRDKEKTVVESTQMFRYLNLELDESPSAHLLTAVGNYLPGNELPQAVFVANRTFTSTGFANLTIQNMFNHYPLDIKVTLQLCERSFVAATAPEFDDTSWTVVASSPSITIPKNTGINNKLIELNIGERTYEASSQLCLRVLFEGAPFTLEFSIFGLGVPFTFSFAHLKFPGTTGSPISYDLKEGDVILPEVPKGIKQIDFIKSVISLFNLYVYAEKERPKHLIFQRYDDYYALASVQNLSTTALDWTDKIDYSGGLKVKSNVQLPKKYLFTMKEDGDFINNSYKTNYSEVYGSFRFNDAYGLTAEKKIEIIFSPSPLVSYKGTGRVHPTIYTVSGNDKKPTKSNIRIMYFNGLKTSQPYSVGKDVLTSGVYDVSNLATGLIKYPQVGNYYLNPGLNNLTPVDDLYFGLPKQMYFDFNTSHQECPTVYTQHYSGQITDLTNPNVSYVECQVYLSEVDIANLNLRTPVFVDMGTLGHAYFKVLSIEYENNNTTSRVQLQKIAI